MLYIVGTPIGNLDDLSYRQARTILASDILLAEDTRSATFLVERAQLIFKLKKNPDQRIISYYKEKEFQKLPKIIETLKEGLNVTLMSESGMPLISDPGHLLVTQVIKENIAFIVVPGPTAVTTVVIYSGFKFESFMFLGFLHKKESQVIKQFESLKEIDKLQKNTLFVFYESPNRINRTLEIMAEQLPQADVCIGRELTKKFEEIIRGKPSQLKDKQYKGEVTVALSL